MASQSLFLPPFFAFYTRAKGEESLEELRQESIFVRGLRPFPLSCPIAPKLLGCCSPACRPRLFLRFAQRRGGAGGSVFPPARQVPPAKSSRLPPVPPAANTCRKSSSRLKRHRPALPLRERRRWNLSRQRPQRLLQPSRAA